MDVAPAPQDGPPESPFEEHRVRLIANRALELSVPNLAINLIFPTLIPGLLVGFDNPTVISGYILCAVDLAAIVVFSKTDLIKTKPHLVYKMLLALSFCNVLEYVSFSVDQFMAVERSHEYSSILFGNSTPWNAVGFGDDGRTWSIFWAVSQGVVVANVVMTQALSDGFASVSDAAVVMIASFAVYVAAAIYQNLYIGKLPCALIALGRAGYACTKKIAFHFRLSRRRRCLLWHHYVVHGFPSCHPQLHGEND